MGIGLSAQTHLDSLAIYNPYTQSDDIRRLIKNNFSILGDDNKLLIKKYEEEILIAQQNKLVEDEVNVLIKSGDIYFQTGLYHLALKYYFLAYDKLKNTNDTLQALILEINIGRAYHFSDLPPSKNYIADAYEKLKFSNDIATIAYASYAQAIIEEDPNRKKKLFKKALSLQLKLIKRKPDDYTLNENLSKYLNANGRQIEALEFAEKSGNKWLQVLYLNNIGYGMVYEGRYKESLEIFYKSLKICIDERLKTLLRNTYDNLSRAHRLLGNWEKATYYLQLMHYVEESLYTENYSLQASEFQIKYETGKKELENNYLKGEQKILSKNISAEKTENFLLSISIGITVFIIAYIFMSRRKLKSANLLLDKKNNEISIQKNQLEQLNDEITKSETNLNIAQATARLANWEWNTVTDEFTFSKTLSQIYGVESDSLKKNFKEIIVDKIHPDYRDHFINFFNRNNFNSDDFDYKMQNGKVDKWLRSKIVTLKDAAGENVKIFGTVQDITKIKNEEKIKIKMAAQQSFTEQLIESQEEERKRIAGELHDSLGQDILLIKNRAQLGLQSESIDNYTREQLTEINISTSGMLSLVREISFNLRPAHLERLGLTETITSAIQRVNDITEINIKHDIQNIDDAFSSDMQINFFRIIQEGLNNIVKHSGAKNASVEVSNNSNNIFLNIIDDGNGFELKSGIETSGGFGLNNILNRVKILNGKLNIVTEKSQGTKLEIILPASDGK